ncbi:MAG: histidinol-phosphatase [Armatimonadota bacterium]
MLTSYHVHTTLSDGENSIDEMVRAAIDANLDEVGVSDHFVLLANGQIVDWSMPMDALPLYFDSIREAECAASGRIAVRRGIEADFDPEAIGQLREIIRIHPFDYVIGSVHIINGSTIDSHAKYWDDLSEPQRNDVILEYWARVTQLARSGVFDFVGHIDLYKKFGALPTVDISEAIMTALDAIAQAGMAIELNTAGWHKPVHEAYPSAPILRGCHKRGIPMLVTADAHNAKDITRDLERGSRLLQNVGYTQQAIYEGRNLIEADING